MSIRLYSYWRSSAAYRVRIVLNIKRLDHEIVPVSLVNDEHRKQEYRAVNPQMLVPFLDDGQVAIGQSQAILEYLDEAYPEPQLLPDSINRRARVRSFCNLICCDVHPLNNLRVLEYLTGELGIDVGQRQAWYAHWVKAGFDAAEVELTTFADEGPFAFGAQLTLADVCLVPQVYNARRFDVRLDDYPRLVAVADACNELEAFRAAVPERQPDCV